MMEAWALPIALYGDTPTMRAAGRSLLPQRDKESDDAYMVRLSETTLVNYFAPAIDGLSGKIFKKPIVLGESLEPYTDWFDNIDAEGSNINDFGMELFAESGKRGVTYFLVDAPAADGQSNSLKDQQTKNIRPYFTHITADQIIGNKTEIINNVLTLSEVRISGTKTIVNDDYTESTIDQVKRIFLVDGFNAQWEISEPRDKKKDSEWDVVEFGSMNVPYIALVPFYTNKEGFMKAKTYFTTLCYLNLQHWQSSSYQRNILNVARIPRLMISGLDEKTAEKVSNHGVSDGIFSESVDLSGKWLECEGKSIGHGERDLENTEAQMAMLSLDPILKKAPSTDLATVANIEASKSNSIIQQWAESLQRALITGVQMMGDIARVEIDASGLKVNDEFQLVDDSSAKMKELREQNAAGLISAQTVLEIGRDIGFYDDDFDVEDEVGRIALQSF
jgi:hypothetical protein